MLHHAMMDRLLAIWQVRNEGSRRFCSKWYESDIESALGGDVALDMNMEFGVLDGRRVVRS